jgi:outer membrane protein TolC
MKMKKKYIMAAVVSLFLSGVLNAQTNTYNIPEQLSELIKKAFDNYPKLKAGDAYIKMDQTQCDLAKAGYMPTIDGEANYRYGKPTPSITFPGFGSFAFFPANNYDLHVGAALPIWDFGRTAANVKKTLAEIQTSKDNLESAKQDLAYQIAELYCAIIFYNKSVEVENEQIKVLQDNVDIIAKRVQDGDALKFDLLSTQVKLNNSQNQLIDLQNNLEKDYEFLDMLTAQQGDGYITREDIGFNTSGHEDVSSDKNYDLIIMNDQMNSSQVDIKSARNNWLPKIVAKAQIGYQDGYVGTEASGGFIPIDKLLLTGSIGVGLSIPIYGADRPNYRIKIAQINVEATKYNIETEKMNLDNQILQAKSDLKATQDKLKNYEVQIEQAKEALNLAEIRYKAGVITNLELLTAQDDAQNAELGEIQLKFQVLLSTLTINKLGATKFW